MSANVVESNVANIINKGITNNVLSEDSKQKSVFKDQFSCKKNDKNLKIAKYFNLFFEDL